MKFTDKPAWNEMYHHPECGFCGKPFGGWKYQTVCNDCQSKLENTMKDTVTVAVSEDIVNESRFIHAFKTIQRAAYENSVNKGFWESPDARFLDNLAASFASLGGEGVPRLLEIAAKIHQQNDGEKIALIHAEASEALEGLRHGNPASDHIPEFTAVEEELADVIIRIMDYAEARRFRVAEAVVAKMKFNATRPYKHRKSF